MGLIFWKFAKDFLFRFDAETAHRLVIFILRFLIRGGAPFKQMPLRWISGSSSPAPVEPMIEVFGVPFASRLGLAAGFDKNAEILAGLPALGFGFAEIGTVTPRPQPGNDRPRLFRDPAREALFNRMGFNGLGAAIISERIARTKKVLPASFRIGINLGKNKDTPLEKAWEDYVKTAQMFEGLADYLVINVSSPNTPGLRSLQTAEALQPIVVGVVDQILKWKKRPPLLLKIAPELFGSELTHLIQSVEPWGIDGWVLTNTLGGTLKVGSLELNGGWSGKPLAENARNSLIEARQATLKPIISVGGIGSPDEARARIAEGASLIQIYTGWIFQGPSFPAQISRRIR
jgi:dihydroorotate dehydrogenase